MKRRVPRRRTIVVLFTRDLRVHDHPALATACRDADRVVPLFVFDDGILRTSFARPNRVAFLLESIGDLRATLERRGGTLVVRRGDVVVETRRLVADVRADAVYASADYSRYARRRENRLAEACRGFRAFPGTTIVPPGVVVPAGGDHFKVFGPYWRAWRRAPRRTTERSPGRVHMPGGIRRGDVPALAALVPGAPSPELPRGGESAGRRLVDRFLRVGLARYPERRDDLAADATSRLGPYLHFGCVSPAALAARVAKRTDAEAFLRQLCWRDFFHQVLAANPSFSRASYRDRRDRWRDDPVQLAAWKAGRTGVPIVDGAMRQLAREGFVPNRARLVAASFLTKDCRLHWRTGARHFWDLLVDGDVASNAGNWQWVAGTGNDPRPNRMFDPVRQARRYDPSGAYVRRWVPELASVSGAAVHAPWTLDTEARARLAYPDPIVDHAEAARRFRAERRSTTAPA